MIYRSYVELRSIFLFHFKLTISINNLTLLQERVKRRYQLYCEIIPGFYKWNEKTVYIKNRERYNYSLLLTELLHAKSITQRKKYIEDWVREGLPHYLARLLCYKCNFEYKKTGYQIYFSFWEKIHKKYNLNVLKTILYTNDIKILKQILKYDKNDILEISFEKAKKLLG